MNNKLKISVIVVFLTVFVFFCTFLSNDIFSGDDALNLMSNTGNQYNICGYFSVFFTKILGKYLPLFFNINPHEFSMTLGAWIRSLNVTVLFGIMALFAFNGRKINFSYTFFVILSAFYFCYASSNVNYDLVNPNKLPVYDLEGTFIMLTEYSQHFGQLVSFIIGLFFIFFINYFFSQNKIPKEKWCWLICFFAYFAAYSSMFVSVVSGIYLLCILLYLIFLSLKDKEQIFSNKNRTIGVAILGYSIGVIQFAFFPKYQLYFSNDILRELKNIVKILVFQNSFEFALIIILSSVAYFLALKKTTFIKRTIFSVYSIIFGALFYFMLFSGLGCEISIKLAESMVLFRLLLFVLILFLFGTCMKELANEVKTKRLIKVVLSTILLFFSVVQIPFIYTTMKLWQTMSLETKTTTYCIEKMYRFYSLLGKTAILPDDSLMKIYKIHIFLDDKNVDKNEKITNRVFFKDTPFTKTYYKTFYKKAKVVPYKFIESKKALKIFFEEGGMIDSKEIQKLNFQKLYDDKFVLNRALIKAKYDR